METWQTVVVVCAGVITVLTLIDKLRGYAQPIAKADRDIKTAVTEISILKEAFDKLKDRIEAVEEHQGNDLKALRNHDISNKLACRALLALLDHQLNGNHTEQLEEARSAIQTYLIEK